MRECDSDLLDHLTEFLGSVEDLRLDGKVIECLLEFGGELSEVIGQTHSVLLRAEDVERV